MRIRLIACVLLIVATTAAQKPLYGTVLTNDGTEYWWYAEGYVDSVIGCYNREMKTGPGNSSAVIGAMWVREGKLYATLGLGGFDKTIYQGTLNSDGSFQLSGSDAIYPSVTVESAGNIHGAIVTGNWTAPYASDCVLHYTITKSHLDPHEDSGDNGGETVPG
jgi:hypothetical protein